MQNIGVPHLIVEMCLNHVLPGIISVYQQSDSLPERAEAFARWGEHLEKLFLEGYEARSKTVKTPRPLSPYRRDSKRALRRRDAAKSRPALSEA